MSRVEKGCSSGLEQNKEDWDMQSDKDLERPRVVNNAEHRKPALSLNRDRQELQELQRAQDHGSVRDLLREHAHHVPPEPQNAQP